MRNCPVSFENERKERRSGMKSGNKFEQIQTIGMKEGGRKEEEMGKHDGSGSE